MNLHAQLTLMLAPIALAGAAHAGFVGYAVDSSTAAGLTTHRVYATFDGTNDTVLRAYGIHAIAGDLNGFVHNDIVSGGISAVAGSWNPNFVLGLVNDSYVAIGGPVGLGAGNTTVPDAGWISGWNQPGIPDPASSGIAGWYNHLTENLQGRADANGRVLLAQFVLAEGHAAKTISLRISHNNAFGAPVTESEGTFSLVPAPGALALLALAGGAARRPR